MKKISIRELHEKTGEWVRSSAKYGEISVTDRGETVAHIVPARSRNDAPYFSHRKLSPAFGRLVRRGALGGTDSTQIISENRDRQVH